MKMNSLDMHMLVVLIKLRNVHTACTWTLKLYTPYDNLQFEFYNSTCWTASMKSGHSWRDRPNIMIIRPIQNVKLPDYRLFSIGNVGIHCIKNPQIERLGSSTNARFSPSQIKGKNHMFDRSYFTKSIV